MAEERKLATILFADLAGSTALADEQDPERTRARLERFYDAMATEIESAGGTVEKFAGDAVMAAFGAPEALEDHAERALHTALAMQRRLESGLALRIGVNTGEVVVGRARENSSFVSGDAVNVAARLEQAAEAGEILAGERTVAAAGAAFEFGELRTVEAKGKSGGVRCRRALRALSLMRPRAGGSAFVGREAELERLWSAYRRSVAGGTPVLVTVLGDPGVGKTRLMRELWERLAADDSPPMGRTGRCLPYGEGITYWPLAEILREHLGILESDAPEDVRRRLGDREILGLTLGLDLAGELHPLAARDRLHAAWVDFIAEQAAERPVVLLVEDVHWAEPPLLELVERLSRDIRGPLLLLATARPDFARSWDMRVDADTIVLEPLAAGLAAHLVDDRLPQDVRDEIVRRAEGNPFFVEELVQLARDEGTSEIPDSVQAVLAARIDLLGEPEKAALQAAAVIGRSFWTGPLYELLGEHAPDLALLESRDFIRRRNTSSLEGEVEYVFKHALTREVAYNTVTKARRARLHAEFAQWLERLAGEHAALLAHHYSEAVRPEDADVAWPNAGEEVAALRASAVLWLERAAQSAVARYELDDALTLLGRALALEEDRPAQARLWRSVGRAQALRYDGEQFIAAMQQALALVDDPVERSETYADLVYEGAMRSGMWRTKVDREVKDEWTTRALADVRDGSPAHVKALVARAYWDLPDTREATSRAGALAEELGDAELLSAVRDAEAMTAFRSAEYATAHERATSRFELRPALNNPDLIHDVYLSAIPTTAAVGQLAEARRLARELDEFVQTLTPHHKVHGVGVRVELEELQADWAAAAALEERIVATVRNNQDTPCIRNPRSLLVCALADEIMGSTRRARELEAEAAEYMYEGFGATLAAPRARMALVRGSVDALEELLADDEWLQRQTWFALPAAAARLDAFAAIGSADETRAAAERLGSGSPYLEPFALRAVGVASGHDALVERADVAFRALSLDWHREQTEPLRRLRKVALG